MSRRRGKAAARKTAARLPGDRATADAIARMIRVDQAGEYGAARIYDGQLAVLKESAAASAVRHMAAQEKRHLERFDALVAERRVRPTALSPLWHVAGYALGAATALLGERAAMACTVAVEEVIDEHYRGQLETLGGADADLAAIVADFRADEIAHRDTALKHGAAEAPGFPVLSAAIKAGSRLAIWLSTRI
ncbi:MAG: demethoxyubiquinone hydroxylase family protein [Alphaproteobacteria bacterium]|nr:demethoxyubiquinone hydroxylase family protein [Alphaproteobacteria bacterium]